MKTAQLSTGILKRLYYIYRGILNLKIFGIPRKKLIFKPDRNTTIQMSNNNMSLDHEKHHFRPNTRPSPEKQTLLKEKKKRKNSI